MEKSSASLAVTYFFKDFLGGIAFFPLWWFTRGLKMVAARAFHSVQEASAYLGLGVWVKNLFVPMYGDTSWQGKIISFFVRLAMIIIRGMGVIAWTIFAFLLLIAYVVSLPLAIIGALYHFGGMLI